MNPIAQCWLWRRQAGRGLLLASVLQIAPLSPARGQTTPFAVLPLYSFSGLSHGTNHDGSAPAAPLIQGADGGFYGTASSGGALGAGTIFQVASHGSFVPLHTFTNGLDGNEPVARLLQAGDGALYGTSEVGGANGSGTLFRVTTNGAFTPLYSFTTLAHATNADGAYPASGLIQCADGGLYGLAAGGGSFGNGTLFRLATNGTFTALYSFGALAGGRNADGANPYARLIQGSDGELYGTTSAGGASGDGTVFRATTNGLLTTLYAFTNGLDGSKPVGRLVQGQGQKLYGTASAGGANGGGTVFRVTTNGVFTSLYSFSAPESGGGPDADGTAPVAGLIQSADGYLYGSTVNGGANGAGTLFRITTNGVFASIYSFTGHGDGANPAASLLEGADGNFYGTTGAGGTNGNGAIFELINPASLPVFEVAPSSSVAVAGASVTLGATVTGPPPFTFQWLFDGAAIPGATSSSLVLTNLQSTQAGNYALVASGLAGSVTSSVARLTIDAWPLVTLYSFTNGFDGAAPDGALILGQDGNLYAAASAGGAFGNGTIFQISPQGDFAPLYSFGASALDPVAAVFTNADGVRPQALLFQANDGNLYSTTEFGGSAGAGTLFRITTDGSFTTLYSFTNGLDGANPVARMFQATDGALYGAAAKGGATGNGTVFRITLGGVFDALYSFSGLVKNAGGILTNAGGANPCGRLIQASDGSLYGVASSGGSGGGGTVFQITTNGNLTAVYNFTNGIDGSKPVARLLLGRDGAFYGTTSLGGTNGGGGVFRVTSKGVFTPLYSFSAARFFQTPSVDGSAPLAALMQGQDGSLYGTASQGGVFGAGTVFQITTNGQFTTLYNFSGGDDGATPVTSLLQTADGNLYGVASAGGSDGKGVVFELFNPNPPPRFTVEPDNVIAPAGGGTTLSATATGGGPLTYQWLFNGKNLGGATNSTLHLENLTGAQTGNYSVVVFNPSGSVTSAVVSLSINTAALIPLYSFTNDIDGASPAAGLVQANDGNFYGTVQHGGTNGQGAIFRISTGGGFSPFYSFGVVDAGGANSGGAQPVARLMQATDGNLYGTASLGGLNGQGTIFRLTTGGLFTPLYSFGALDASGTNADGAQPNAGLLQAADGSFYGSAQAGGLNGNGTVFRLTTNGQFSVLHTFAAGIASGVNPDGEVPLGQLIQGSDGGLYGTANSGGSNGFGSIYRITTSGQFTLLYTFGGGDDGAYPWARLLQGPDGALYSTVPGGGTSGTGQSGSGAVYRITTNGVFTSLYSFTATNAAGINADGALSLAGLIRAADGYLYGTASIGGAGGNGTLFRVATNGAFTLLYSFNATPDATNLEGAQPYSDLLQGVDGNFYGTAIQGGVGGAGTVFEMFNLLSRPVFTGQPGSQIIANGGGATLGVSVAGAGPLAVQWLLNGIVLPGATNETLTLAHWSAAQAGGYSAVAGNANGSVTSLVARIPYFGLALSSGSALQPVLTLGDIPNSHYRIDTSTDLGSASNWTTLSNIILTTSPRSFNDTIDSSGPRRFYRAVPLP